MNTSKKIISFLILVFAMLTITTISSFAAEDTRIEVSEFIATSDFVEPAYNSKVNTAYKFTFTTGAQAQAYSRMSGWHKWNEEISDWERYSDSRFSTGKYRYFIQIRIDSDSGCGTTHKLAKTATVIVDGAEWEYSDNPTVESDYSYTYIYSPEFDVKKIIKKVEITDLTMPIIGENPDYDISVPSGMGYYVSQYEGKDYVDWYANGIMTEILPVNYKYNSSAEYIFATLIEAEEGCEFSSDVTVMVGDLSARVASNRGDSIVIMLENIKAVERTYTVTVSNATASKQQAKAGEIITLTANAPSVGEIFDKWLVSGATVANAASKTTTFTMPENDVTATATYKNCIHTYENVITKATLSKNGKIESKCSVCGKVKPTQTIAKIGSVTLSATKYIHDGKNKTPTVTVKDANGKKLIKNTDYKLSVASSRKGIGKYTVKVTFIGKYSGTKNVYFTILPGKPASVKSAAQTTSSIKLSWSAVSGAAGYTVYRYSPSKKAYVKAGTTTGTSLTVKGLLTGTKYTFKVVAYGKTSGGKVYNSEGYTLLKTATKTKTPELTKVTASSTKGKAYVYHSNVSGETGYTVYYSTSKTSGFKKYANFKADTTRCDITKLTSGKTYYFKVRTYIKTDSGYVYSPWSAVKGIKVK